MLATEDHVLNSSPFYIHTPSALARRLFFYPLRVGHFYYIPGYSLRRSSFNSYELLYVVNGAFGFDVGQGEQTLLPGETALIDCYKPHSFFCKEACELYWLHFDGVLARDYYNLITSSDSAVIHLKNNYTVEKDTLRIFNAFHEENAPNEALISRFITDILTEMILSKTRNNSAKNHSDIIEETIAYINDHLGHPLSVDELAHRASFSTYYFIRLFKKVSGYTIHEYINEARINAAKYYLKSTTLPIKEICYTVGFSDESNFCTAFKRMTGQTPRSFRCSDDRMIPDPRRKN